MAAQTSQCFLLLFYFFFADGESLTWQVPVLLMMEMVPLEDLCLFGLFMLESFAPSALGLHATCYVANGLVIGFFDIFVWTNPHYEQYVFFFVGVGVSCFQAEHLHERAVYKPFITRVEY